MNSEYYEHIRDAQHRIDQLHREAQSRRDVKAAFANPPVDRTPLLARLFRRHAHAQPNSHSA
ncbi:hypothetical protein [Deinococcus peraridilitoris]|nr:hypothetical protein [Deinococcus peraridilitoris]